MTTINHEELERIARDICEKSRGPGAWDRKGCKRLHWRAKAAEILALAEASFDPWKVWGTLL